MSSHQLPEPINTDDFVEMLWRELSEIIQYDEEKFNDDSDLRIPDDLPFSIHDVARTYYETPYLFWYATYATLACKFPAKAPEVLKQFTEVLLRRMPDRVHPDVFRIYATRFQPAMQLPQPGTEPMKSDVILSGAGYAAYRIFGKQKGDQDLVIYMTLPAIRIAGLFQALHDMLEDVHPV